MAARRRRNSKRTTTTEERSYRNNVNPQEPLPPVPEHPPKPRYGKPPDWTPTFLEWLAKSNNVYYACRQANTSPTTAYKRRKDDSAFRKLWKHAEVEAVEALKQSAREQAIGLDAAGQLATRGNDRLMSLLLKAYVPEFRDAEEEGNRGNQVQVVITMPGNNRDLPPERMPHALPGASPPALPAPAP